MTATTAGEKSIARKAPIVIRRMLAPIVFLALGAGPEIGVGADLVPDEYRVAYAVQKFDSTVAGVLAYDLPPIRFLGSLRSEVAFGTIYANGDWAALVSGGPIWGFRDIGGSTVFLEFSINPTVLSRTHFDGEDMGSHFHFTSALALGRRFGDWDVAIRIQHTSNAGLSDANPGMDMVALAFSRR